MGLFGSSRPPPHSEVRSKSYRVFRPRQWASLERGAGCPRWGIRIVLTAHQTLPVYPYKQTFSESVGMSQRCQKRHCMILAMALSNPRPLDLFTPIIDIDSIYVAHDTGEF